MNASLLLKNRKVQTLESIYNQHAQHFTFFAQEERPRTNATTKFVLFIKKNLRLCQLTDLKKQHPYFQRSNLTA